MKRQLAFILAFERKGELSQNTQNVMGKPLISWLLDTVTLTSLFYRVWVVTNCEKTKQFVAKKYGAMVTVYSSPETDEKFLPDLVAQMTQEGVLCVTDYLVLFRTIYPFISVKSLLTLNKAFDDPAQVAWLAYSAQETGEPAFSGRPIIFATTVERFIHAEKLSLAECGKIELPFFSQVNMKNEVNQRIIEFSLISLQKYDKGYYPPSSIRIKEDKIVWCEKDSYGEIPIEDVTVIKYEKPYSHLFMKDRKSVLLKTGLAFWEHELPSYFIRINRGTLINAYHITSAREEGTEYVVRDNKQNRYVVSKRKCKEVCRQLRLWKGA